MGCVYACVGSITSLQWNVKNTLQKNYRCLVTMYLTDLNRPLAGEAEGLYSAVGGEKGVLMRMIFSCNE